MKEIAGRLVIGLIGLALSASLAGSQENFPTPGGSRVPGHVSMCLDAQGNAVATNQAGACPGGGGGGGGAVTVVDGGDVAQGTTTDAACATDNGTCTELALIKRENQRLTSIITALGSPFQAGGALAANQSINNAQIAGTAAAVGSGAMNAGTQRMALATDSPGIGALGQNTKANSVSVTIASDQYIDPCQSPNITKSSVPINITTATTTSLVAVSGSTIVYVCGISLTVSEVITTPNTILFEYGTGAACTSPTALTGKFGDGGVTAGIPIVIGSGSGMTIFKSAAAAGICALTAIGATASFQGVMTYVQQ